MSGARFVAHARRSTGLFMLIASLGFCAMFGTALFLRHTNVEGTIFLGGGFAIFAYCAGLALVRLFRSAPVLEIDAHTISWPWHRISVPWNVVASAEMGEYKRIPLLKLTLREEADFDVSSSRHTRLVRMNRENGVGDMCVSVRGTDRSFSELVEVVRAFVPVREAG